MSLKSLAGFTGLFAFIALTLALVCASCSNPTSASAPTTSALEIVRDSSFVMVSVIPLKNSLNQFLFNGGLYDSISCYTDTLDTLNCSPQNFLQYLYSWGINSNFYIKKNSWIQIRLFNTSNSRPDKIEYFYMISDTTIY